MTKDQANVILGGLLHDIGKVIYRQGDDRRKHSQSGYDFLIDEAGVNKDEADFLECVRYHHAGAIQSTHISDDSIAYIIYMADNIAASVDRRENGNEEYGFEINTSLQSVFGILNGNNEDCWYSPGMLNPEKGINYPTTENKKFDESFYSLIKDNLKDNLRGIDLDTKYINSLLEVLEANLSFVPSSTSKSERADISLYDHLKMTAGISSCIYEYFSDNGELNYRDRLFVNGKEFYDKEAFLIYSLDMSGIQNYIYTISTKNALKTLRVRSFYLEIMMEHVVDELLESVNLSRANLIYIGGGHCYLLMPNTEKIIERIEKYIADVNRWLLNTFDISLYIASGYASCSADSLKNIPNGSYEDIFREISNMLSDKKSHKYNAETIRMLNHKKIKEYTRECIVCKRNGTTDENGRCRICSSIEKFSQRILYDDIFIIKDSEEDDSLPLPNGGYLTAINSHKELDILNNRNDIRRIYTKNRQYTGKYVASRIWIADYNTGQTFDEFEKESKGIDRIAVLRADVDNLGRAFVSGFKNENNQDKYVTISRTATLSRHLSMFFKLHLNDIMKNPEFRISDSKGGRKLSICYSGGDDLFIVGAWNDVIEAAIDIRKKFERYTRGTLTLSAGISLYQSGYPINAAAGETAYYEEMSKSREGKAAVTVLSDGMTHKENDKIINDGTYPWVDFEEKVIGEKLDCITEYLKYTVDRGKAFLYRLLELIRGRSEKINFARCVYLLSRIEPDKTSDNEMIVRYRTFSTNICKWIRSDKDCRELKTAINIYVYLNREEVSNEY